MILWLILILINLFDNNLVSAISCKNDQGYDVDWFVLLKPPPQLTASYVTISYFSIPSKDNLNPLNRGSGYYYKSKDSENDFKFSPKSMSDLKSHVGYTFGPVYAKPDSFSYVQFNDLSPENNGPDSIKSTLPKYAISKGTLVWDNISAVFFLHSVPEFLPPFGLKKYEYPAKLRARIKGQNFICLTLPLSYVNAVLDHLVNAHPKVYSLNLATGSTGFNQYEQARIEESAKLLTGQHNTIIIRSTDYNNLYPSGPEMKSKVTGWLSKQTQLSITIATSQKDKLLINSKSKYSKTNFFAKRISPKIHKLKNLVSLGSLGSKTKSFFKKVKTLLFKDCPKLLKLGDFLGLKTSTRRLIFDKERIYFGGHDNLKTSLCLGANNYCFCVDDYKQHNLDFNQGAISVCIFNKELHEAFENVIKAQEECN